VRHYADRVISSANTINASNAIGNSLGTQATLVPPTLIGAARLRLGFPAVSAPGNKAGLIVNSGGLLTLAALNGLAIRTYLSPSNDPQETIAVSDLLTLSLLNVGQSTAELTAQKPFDQIELVAGGLLSAYTVGLVAAYATVTPLPVQLVSFAGQASAGGVQLSWQTASELNSHAFVVERAAAAQAEFVALGEVAAAGNSAQARRYQFLDARALAVTSYYRLRQVDADGQTHFSPVVAVQASPGPALAAYPSPAAASLTVACPSATPAALYDAQGRLVRQLALAAGTQTLDVSQLPAGLYYLHEATTGQRLRFEKAR
jgi:hypothetical protein